jgi:hypothetical protein
LLIVAAFIVTVALSARRKLVLSRLSPEAIIIGTTIITAFAQAFFGSTPKQFDRYNSYIYASIIVSAALAIVLTLRRTSILRFAKYLIIASIAMIFLPKFFFYLDRTPIESKNIFDMQLQMAKFVDYYCNNQPVVIVDIGAVSYFSRSEVIDLIGLGTDKIARQWLRPTDLDSGINSYIRSRNACVAIIYPITRYSPDTTWILKGRLQIDSNYICARDTVAFYALRTEDTSWLGNSLRDFQSKTNSKIFVY